MFLLLLCSLFSLTASFLFPSSNCGCAAPCSAPPVCAHQCLVQQPCPQPVARPVDPCCSTCTQCKKARTKREVMEYNNTSFIVDEDVRQVTHRQKRDENEVLDEIVKIDAKCNSEQLRDIIIQNIDRVTSISKRRIQAEAEKQLNARFNVICARGDFSYITNTEEFCQQTIGDVTCYVFKQLSQVLHKNHQVLRYYMFYRKF